MKKVNKRNDAHRTAFRISLIYLLLSVLWITGSGYLATKLAGTTHISLEIIEFVKGIFFVFVTFFLFYILIKKSFASLAERQASISRLNRVYTVLSNINSVILRAENKQQLLETACNIAVRHGGYCIVCIRLVNMDNNTLEIVALRSKIPEFEPVKRIPLADVGEMDQDPAAIVLRNKTSLVINELSTDENARAWKDCAEKYGIESCAGFPIYFNEQIQGVITFYSDEAGIFDKEEIRLLAELASDASVGLGHITNRERLHYISNYDTVTGLPNRNLLLDRFSQSVSAYGYRNSRLVAILAVSIENYRKIIDTFGIATGDGILVGLAGFLKGKVRGSDTVARVGNHDFLVLLTDIASNRDLTLVVRKLFSSLPQVISAGSDEVVMHYRGGVSVYADDSANPEETIRQAGLALTAARAQQEPYQYYSMALDKQSNDEYTLERELQSALARGELSLHYQPIITLAGKRLEGFEALLRWNNGVLGQVPPATFIPVAESAGLMIDIGNWVLEQAAVMLRQLGEAGNEDIYISVNVSSYQLKETKIAGMFLDILNKAGFSAHKNRLVLEITESALIENPAVVISKLEKFRMEGLKIYVDDFGTGYSSLSYLRQFPVDALKIDREFINDIHASSDAEALVKGIIGMAKGIGLNVVAEGIETEGHYNTLVALGCDMGQGYYFNRPMPADQVRLLLQKQHQAIGNQGFAGEEIERPG